jgi:hypothetical protein
MISSRKKDPARPQPREFNITGSIIPEEHYYENFEKELEESVRL